MIIFVRLFITYAGLLFPIKIIIDIHLLGRTAFSQLPQGLEHFFQILVNVYMNTLYNCIISFCESAILPNPEGALLDSGPVTREAGEVH